VELNRQRGFEKEDLGFFLVDVHSGILAEGLDNGKKSVGLVDCGGSHN
jgi:hypothetical protein